MTPRFSTTWLTASSDADLDNLAQSIIAGLTDNEAFPEPSPSLEDLSALLLSFSTALSAAKNGGPAGTAAKNSARLLLAKGFRELGGYLDKTAQSLEQALSSNYPLKKAPSPVGIQPAPVNLRLKHGKVSGSVVATCKNPGSGMMLDWQSAVGAEVAPGGWVTEPSTLSARMSFSGLVPGSYLNVRCRVRVVAGAGDWSGPARIMIL